LPATHRDSPGLRPSSPERGERRRTAYHEIEAKTILNRVRGMPFDWSISAYRGCTHACTYCYARASHGYLGYGTGADFEHEIVVKTNAVELLNHEIQHPRMRGQTIVTGTVSDPYQPAEARYRLTRDCLAVLLASGNPVGITTKSSLITRDLDLLAALATGPGCTVHMTITTLDRDIARKLEPRTPSPAQRLAAIRTLAEAGVDVGVFVGPVFPGLTDSPEQLADLAQATAEAGATFLEAMQRDFPELAPRYRAQARNGGMDRQQVKQLSTVFDDLRFRFGLAARPDHRAVPDDRPRQLALPV
jgi:DNA repair photolyase